MGSALLKIISQSSPHVLVHAIKQAQTIKSIFLLDGTGEVLA